MHLTPISACWTVYILWTHSYYIICSNMTMFYFGSLSSPALPYWLMMPMTPHASVLDSLLIFSTPPLSAFLEPGCCLLLSRKATRPLDLNRPKFRKNSSHTRPLYWALPPYWSPSAPWDRPYYQQECWQHPPNGTPWTIQAKYQHQWRFTSWPHHKQKQHNPRHEYSSVPNF